MQRISLIFVLVVVNGQTPPASTQLAGCVNKETDTSCSKCANGWDLNVVRRCEVGTLEANCPTGVTAVGAVCDENEDKNVLVLNAAVAGIRCFRINCDGVVTFNFPDDFDTGCDPSKVPKDCGDGTCNILENHSFTLETNPDATTSRMAVGCGAGTNGGFFAKLPVSQGLASVLRLNTQIAPFLGKQMTVTWNCSKPYCAATPAPTTATAAPDSNNSDGQEMLVIGIIVLALILIGFFAIYYFFCLERDRKTGDEEDHNKHLVKERELIPVQETMRRSNVPPPVAYLPPVGGGEGYCEIEFRTGDIWRRGEITNTLPNGMVEIQGPGSMKLCLPESDVRPLSLPTNGCEAVGYITAAAPSAAKCGHRSTAPPSLRTMRSKKHFPTW